MNNPLSRIQLSLASLASAEPISDKRRSTAYKLCDSTGRPFFLKVRSTTAADEELTGVARPARLIREARVLSDAEQFLGRRFIAAGRNDEFYWLLTTWLEGPDCGAEAKLLRGQRDSTASGRGASALVSMAVELADCLAGLHGAGYLHGDLQPSHFLRTHLGWAVVDFELAHQPGDAEVNHRGCLVHYNAPEVARQMLDGSPVVYTLAAEVYAFSALLWVLYTGLAPVNYGSPDYKSVPLREKLASISDGKLSSFDVLGAPPFPDFETALIKGLAYRPEDRYECISEFRDCLHEIL